MNSTEPIPHQTSDILGEQVKHLIADMTVITVKIDNFNICFINVGKGAEHPTDQLTETEPVSPSIQPEEVTIL